MQKISFFNTTSDAVMTVDGITVNNNNFQVKIQNILKKAIKIIRPLVIVGALIFADVKPLHSDILWDVGANVFSNGFWDIRKNSKDTLDFFYENVNVGGGLQFSYKWIRLNSGVGNFLTKQKTIPSNQIYGFAGIDVGEFNGGGSVGIEYGFLNYNYIDINLKGQGGVLPSSNFQIKPKITWHIPINNSGTKFSAGLEFGWRYGKTESQRVQDSIASHNKKEEKERIKREERQRMEKAEQERLAVIEKAKRDSIATVEREEQERQRIEQERLAAIEKIERERQFQANQLEVSKILQEKIMQGNIDWSSDDLKSIKCENEKFGFIHKRTNQFIIPCEFDDAEDFEMGVAMVKLNNKFGFIDKMGIDVIPIEYDYIGSFNDGLAIVKLDYKFGFINRPDDKSMVSRSSQTIIPIKYDDAKDFKDGKAEVKLDGKTFYIDKIGRETEPPVDAADEYNRKALAIADSIIKYAKRNVEIAKDLRIPRGERELTKSDYSRGIKAEWEYEYISPFTKKSHKTKRRINSINDWDKLADDIHKIKNDDVKKHRPEFEKQKNNVNRLYSSIGKTPETKNKHSDAVEAVVKELMILYGKSIPYASEDVEISSGFDGGQRTSANAEIEKIRVELDGIISMVEMLKIDVLR